MLASRNPATGELVAQYESATPADAEALVAAVAAAQRAWRDVPLDERVACLGRLADALEAQRDEGARLMAVEMANP